MMDAGIWGLFLPSPAETLLLRGCLRDDMNIVKAMTTWFQSAGGVESVLSCFEDGARFAPLLAAQLVRHGGALDRRAMLKLQAAKLYSQRRSAVVSGIVADVLMGLTDAMIPNLVGKGAALAAINYDEPWQRHCHDLDLLVPPAFVEQASDILRKKGFVVASRTSRNDSGSLSILHSSGFPVVLHTHLFPFQGCTPSLATAMARSIETSICARPVRILDWPDMLLQVMVLAATKSHRRSAAWIIDAWHIVSRTPKFDWDAFVDIVRASRWKLPVSVALDFLALELGLSIPVKHRDALHQEALACDRASKDIALFGLRNTANGSIRTLFHAAQNARSRINLMRWLFLPSPAALLETGVVNSRRQLPWYYLGRPMVAAIRRVKG